MRQRNRLYTVNKYNRPMFMPKENLFAYGTPTLNGIGQMNVTGGLGNVQAMANNPTTLTNAKLNAMNQPSVSRRGLLGGLGSGIGSALIGGAAGLGAQIIGDTIGGVAGAIGSGANSLLGGKKKSGVGNAVQSVTGGLGDIVGGVPIIGGLAKGALNLVGGITGGIVNGLFGQSVDEEALQEANAGINAYNNFNSNAGSFDEIEGPQAQAGVRDIYADGLFGGDADEKNEAKRREFAEAKSRALRSVNNNVRNLVSDQMNDALANFSAFGGRVNRFADGGLKAAFLDSFGSDPIGATVRYNQELEALAAQEEARQAEAAREAKYLATQQRMANLETENQGLQALMAAQVQSPAPMIPEYSLSPSTATQNDYSKLKGALKMSEGFTGKAYTLGSEKHPTVGYGFYNIYPGTTRRVQVGDTITREEADRYLDTAIAERERELAKKVPNWDKMAQNQRDALIDLAFNAGSAAPHFRRDSKLMKALANEDWEEASKHLATTSRNPDFAKGMRNRSNRRRNMFVNGDYGLKAFGGELGTNGTDFTNGLLYIDEGGTHEDNPLDGVPMGLDSEGIPNLVEEGETVYNDYVFSDRMMVPDFMLKDLGLPKSKKGISFADASKKLAQESEKRPNDPISMEGLQASLSRLAEIQETERMRKQAKEYVGLEEYACGGKLGRKYAGPGNQDNQLKPYKFDPIESFKYWNKDDGDYDAGYRDFIENKLNEDWINRVMAGNYGDMSRYRGANNFNPTVDQALQLGLDYKNSDWHKAMAAAYDEYKAGIDPKSGEAKAPQPTAIVAAPEENTPETAWNFGDLETARQEAQAGFYDDLRVPATEVEEQNPHTYPTWMRYAPAVGAGIMTLTDALGLTNRPDYSGAAGIEAAARAAGYAPKVSYKPIGNYLRYSPMDIWFEQNRMDANARATDRALMNTSSPSRAAGLIANGYNSQLASGQLYRNALEYNDARKERVADFNRRTNMFNSQMGLEAAMANARYQQAAKQMGLSGIAQAAALRNDIDARIGAARSANLTNFLTSLGNIGRENFALNQLNTDRSRSYSTDASGRSSYKRKKKSGK